MPGFTRAAVLLFFAAGRAAGWFIRATDYLAVGTRRRADIREDGIRMWCDFYQTHPSHDGKLLPWEEDVAQTFVRAGSDVLIVGSGSGRDVVAFVERGCRVTGLEPVAVAVRHCRRLLEARGLTATLVEGFFEEVRLSGRFDTIVFSYYCYAAMPGREHRVGALRKAAALLNPGGHIVVSHASEIVPPRPILVRLGRFANRVSGSDWRIEAGDLVWHNPGSKPSYSYTHVFAAGELEREAAAAGLDVALRQQSADNSVVFVLGAA